LVHEFGLLKSWCAVWLRGEKAETSCFQGQPKITDELVYWNIIIFSDFYLDPHNSCAVGDSEMVRW
jgi:hypothetical protein